MRSTCAIGFTFELTAQAAEKNLRVLEHHHFNLEQAIENNSNSPLQAGSEFRPVNIIEPIFSRHPLWIRLQRLLKFGSDWKLDIFDHDQ